MQRGSRLWRGRGMEMLVLVHFGLLLLVVYLIQKLLILFWWKPKKIQKFLLNQGIGGPPFRPIIGSLGDLAKIYAEAEGAPPPPPPSETNPHHNTLQLVFPHLPIWKKKYGSALLYWYGRFPRLTITDPKLIKEVTSNPRKFGQSKDHPVTHELLGGSLLDLGGEAWATRRRLMSPLFLADHVKGLSEMIRHAVEDKVEAWRKLLESSDEVEIAVHDEFENLIQYIIAKVLFGNDVKEGIHLVQLQAEQATLVSQTAKIFYIPGSWFIPTKLHRRSKWLRKEVEKKLKELMHRRLNSESKIQDDDDWLSMMLSSNNMTHKQILDDCCGMMIAGSETTNLLLSWACILLSIHTEWQDKAREEIHRVLLQGGHSQPTLEDLPHIKTLNMILNETFRLYPSAPLVMKKTYEEIPVEGFTIPAGIHVEIPIIAVHHDPQQWGDNVDEFDPGRFADGTAKASKHPMAFMPFMIGPRICIGMNFAMMEARITLAMILNNFKMRLSPNYKHEPVIGMTLKPKNGAYVLFRKI